MRDMVSSWKVFDKEKLSYSCYIPEFEQMFRDVNMPIKFGANYYEASNVLLPSTELIILEDLGNRGFKNANRQPGLDMKHTLAVLEKLSQFHAASAVRYELKGAYPKIYDRSLCCDEDKFQEFRDTQARSLIEALPLYDAAYLESALVNKKLKIYLYFYLIQSFFRSPTPLKLQTCSKPTRSSLRTSFVALITVISIATISCSNTMMRGKLRKPSL